MSGRRSLTAEANEQKAIRLKALKFAAANLLQTSEKFRELLDEMDRHLSRVVETGIELNRGHRIRERVNNVRHLRNSMECFQLSCMVDESVDVAWKDLP